ncbi:hypothetical protein PAALTS15_16076 [Paenibacillus alvei TS-15]|uniref:Uncharacterized protein n=1 Tax=Paenibacillus alvei TS-15 TaxID=1117108 RepID=S9SNF7_PAEAL|nr:hypothetical protein [Paenibacillus alvei]EPY06249.1 hypothetical protein PAALTS15_16076 [Paenibacillus alvei TS-15]
MTTTFTKVVGIGFIILSVLRLTPIINATGKWLLYVSIAAFFLILLDVIEYILEGIKEERGFKGINLKVLHSTFLGCAVIAIIVLPNLKIDIPVKTVNAWSDAISLISLGLAITLIGFKTERTRKSISNKTMFTGNEVSEFFKSTEGQNLIDERIRRLALQDVNMIGEFNAESEKCNSR